MKLETIDPLEVDLPADWEWLPDDFDELVEDGDLVSGQYWAGNGEYELEIRQDIRKDAVIFSHTVVGETEDGDTLFEVGENELLDSYDTLSEALRAVPEVIEEEFE